MSTVMGIVQYDFEFGNNNVPYMCGVVLNASSPYAGLAKLFVSQSSGCNDILFNDFIASLTNVTYDPAQNMRQWTYQTCTEFGLRWSKVVVCCSDCLQRILSNNRQQEPALCVQEHGAALVLEHHVQARL
jgi:hypothetical protein